MMIYSERRRSQYKFSWWAMGNVSLKLSLAMIHFEVKKIYAEHEFLIKNPTLADRIEK